MHVDGAIPRYSAIPRQFLCSVHIRSCIYISLIRPTYNLVETVAQLLTEFLCPVV